MRFALIGFVQKDILNPATLGIDPSDVFMLNLQDYIENNMTEENGYLNVTYTVLNNGIKPEDYAKSNFAETVSDPFCMERTEGYNIELNLIKQAPIPRYFVKMKDFNLFDRNLEVRPYRVEGEFVAHVIGQQPSYEQVINDNIAIGFQQFELTGAWTLEALRTNVRKMLDRGAYVDIKTDLIACDQPWLDAVKDDCFDFVNSGHLAFV